MTIIIPSRCFHILIQWRTQGPKSPMSWNLKDEHLCLLIDFNSSFPEDDFGPSDVRCTLGNLRLKGGYSDTVWLSPGVGGKEFFVKTQQMSVSSIWHGRFEMTIRFNNLWFMIAGVGIRKHKNTFGFYCDRISPRLRFMMNKNLHTAARPADRSGSLQTPAQWRWPPLNPWPPAVVSDSLRGKCSILHAMRGHTGHPVGCGNLSMQHRATIELYG